MFGDIVIAIEETHPLRFRLGERGAPPRITTAAVVDLANEQPVWWLVPASFTAVVPFTVEEVSPEDIEALAEGIPFDPIEDLPPSDPRHQEALAERDTTNETRFPTLESLTYGVVPVGFRQAGPEGGVLPLIPGRAYTLSVIGPSGHGCIEFRV